MLENFIILFITYLITNLSLVQVPPMAKTKLVYFQIQMLLIFTMDQWTVFRSG